MLNHLRCLLLNRDGVSAPPADFFGEEAVEPDYRELVLPGYLNAVRAILFGHAPDRYMLNYRLKQYLTILHATPLVDYVDVARTTYDVSDDRLVHDTLFVPTVTPVVRDPEAVFDILGNPEIPDIAGKLYYRFDVSIDEGIVHITRQAPDFSESDVTDMVLTDGLSNAIPFPGSGYQFKTNVIHNGRWIVEIINRPQWDIGTIVANLATLGATTFANLFGTTDAEPFRTCRKLWEDNGETPLKLAAILLATAIRTEQWRLRNG